VKKEKGRGGDDPSAETIHVRTAERGKKNQGTCRHLKNDGRVTRGRGGNLKKCGGEKNTLRVRRETQEEVGERKAMLRRRSFVSSKRSPHQVCAKGGKKKRRGRESEKKEPEETIGPD